MARSSPPRPTNSDPSEGVDERALVAIGVKKAKTAFTVQAFSLLKWRAGNSVRATPWRACDLATSLSAWAHDRFQGQRPAQGTGEISTSGERQGRACWAKGSGGRERQAATLAELSRPRR